jgi:hypothetical protein
VFELGLWLPGDGAMPAEQLRQAVPGLAGVTGLLLFPALGSWTRVLLEYLEWSRPGLGRPKGISGVRVGQSVLLSLLLGFFVLTLVRAAGELRHIQAEEPVVLPSIQGIVVGILFWAVYALGISALRADWRRRRSDRRVGGLLR